LTALYLSLQTYLIFVDFLVSRIHRDYNNKSAYDSLLFTILVTDSTSEFLVLYDFVDCTIRCDVMA